MTGSRNTPVTGSRSAPEVEADHGTGDDATTSRRVERIYLQLESRAQFRPAQHPRRPAQWRLMPAPTVAEWRHLYASVGAEWHWHDRDAWSDAGLAERLASPTVHVFRVDAALDLQSNEMDSGVGFVELEQHDDANVEIVYLGLTRRAQGLGLGGWLLQRAVEEAWALGASRVWLHTCTLDSVQALPNYLARGFEIERIEEYTTP